MTIPFNRLQMLGDEAKFIEQALANSHLMGDGGFTRKCHALLEQTLGVGRALLTTSCTHALEMAGLLLDLKPGDEVIVPSFTFVSTANAFVLRGARPVFADIRPDTLNLDERKVESLITERTRLIVPVHYAGVGCEMDTLLEIARRRGVAVVEDNAHGLFGRYRGRALGTFGSFSTLSFHETKNVSCGEGGALLVNDPRHVERAEIIREKGTNRSRFFRGMVDKYTWVDVGSSYVMSDLLAAFLYGQLLEHERIQSRRRALWETYHRELAGWAAAQGVSQPHVPAECEQAYHMYYLLMPSLEVRTRFIQQLRQQGINAVFHYLPLHVSDMGRTFGGQVGDCPVTESISDRLVRLPFFSTMTEQEQTTVLSAVRDFRC
ncbi:dTDP-4-amino-4,6-dideoxygalactose transaminase [Myxococcus fulvus]|uniref:dTDP-4-amino-4,6-dideoxy-D-glucose transaminase n=1 Tax=Myxococcus fulvus TaxID=33 RepID=A0A511SX05_MYXFU|nr:dTDP-4-amino-4,6-dideoxygalactose transaminase [Myxococcus fulvus]GEN06425.1 dTDP-4-amino-4,6-dideoxy-D-glucose transaminase [Myxococcus fulvus]SET49045.1 dTDP-4-amino-4,6-dideoxygalactose transaminase [Myxococcus fulvus]